MRRTLNIVVNVVLTLFIAGLVWAFVMFFTANPAQAHNRCDHADHSHRRWTATRTWVEHWRYLRHEAPASPRVSGMDVWSVNGRLVRLPSSQCR